MAWHPDAWAFQQIAVLGQPVSALELVAFATGLACVWLTKQMRVANWPVGLVSVGCYGLLFFHAKLYADAALQAFFFLFGIWGWRAWAAGRGVNPDTVTVSTHAEYIGIAAIALVFVPAIAWLLVAFTDSPVPIADSAIFVLSLLALWAQMRKKLESWWLWIVVDLISIPIYLSRKLLLSALLYGVFLALCIAGLRAWQGRIASRGSA